MLGNEISCVVKMEDSACVRKHVLNVFDVFNKKFYDVLYRLHIENLISDIRVEILEMALYDV